MLDDSDYKHTRRMYKVVQIWPGQTVTCLHTNNPGHIWTTLCNNFFFHGNNGFVEEAWFLIRVAGQ